MLINGVATVTYVFNKLLPLLFNMNILVFIVYPWPTLRAFVFACRKILTLAFQVEAELTVLTMRVCHASVHSL